MSRFGGFSIQTIGKNIAKNESKNSTSNRRYVWKQFMDFCAARGYVLDNKTSITDLAAILTDWAFNMRKQNGEEYKDYTVKTIWNVSAKLLMEKYYKDYGIIFNPFFDIQFKQAREAKQTKRKVLRTIPEKRKRTMAFRKERKELKKLDQSCNGDAQDRLQEKVPIVLVLQKLDQSCNEDASDGLQEKVNLHHAGDFQSHQLLSLPEHGTEEREETNYVDSYDVKPEPSSPTPRNTAASPSTSLPPEDPKLVSSASIDEYSENQNQGSDGDIYDAFGKYVAAMLRSIGPPDSLRLQNTITSTIVNVICSEQSLFGHSADSANEVKVEEEELT